MSSRRFWLREFTARSHADLEAVVGAFDDLAAYRRYALGLYRGRAPIERWLGAVAWPSHFADWRPSLIADALGQDLTDLGIDRPPHGPPPPLSGGVEDLLGTAYVLEGSGLGAKLVYRRASALGLDDRFGARHLADQAKASGWKRFVDLLETAPAPDMDRVGKAALLTFDAMRDAMAGHAAA
jgi:heme oxygenase